MTPLHIALTLAKFAPTIIGYLSGDKAESAANKVVELAEQVTGISGDAAVTAIADDPANQEQFNNVVLANKAEMDAMYLADRNSARAMYLHNQDATDKISYQIMTYNIGIILVLVVINVLAIYVLKDNGSLIAAISNIIGFVTNALLTERQQVCNFRYGSSVGSKMKSLTATEGGK